MLRPSTAPPLADEAGHASMTGDAGSDGQDDPNGADLAHGPKGPRRVRGEPMPKKKLSQILHELVSDVSRDRVSVADLVSALDARAFGALLLVFALPNVLPTPPGFSGILGLPLLYLSTQMLLGKMPWLPPFIAKRSMSREDMARVMTRVTPRLTWVEKLLVPRLPALSTPFAERAIGALCLILAIVLVLPIPLGNMPPAFALCLIALGVLERDGVWIILGDVMASLALVIVYGVVYTATKAVVFLLANSF